MKIGPFYVGWERLDNDDIAAMQLDRAYRWEGWTLAVDIGDERRGFFVAVRPIVGRGYA